MMESPMGIMPTMAERLNFPYVDPFCCGFHQPSHNLVNFFVVNDSGLPVAVTDPAWNATGTFARDTNFVAKHHRSRGSAAGLDAGRDGVPYKDWGIHSSAFNRDGHTRVRTVPRRTFTKSASGAQSGVGWNSFQLNFRAHPHLPAMRMRCCSWPRRRWKRINLEEARGIVNQIRARAGQTPRGVGLLS